MKHSLRDLFRTLLGDIRTLLRQELMLVKTEMTEKASHLGRSGMVLALGGSAAYAGLIVLLIGFGFLLAWALTVAGIPDLLAGFIGLAVIGLLVAGIGAMMLFKALHALQGQSLVPQKSVEALQHFKEVRSGAPAPQVQETALPTESKLSSEELKNVAFSTEEMLDKTLDELQARLSPRQVAQRMKQRVVEHPARIIATMAALTGGLVGTALLIRKLRHA